MYPTSRRRSSSAMEDEVRGHLERYLEVIREDLDNTIAFWLKYSHDDLYGGFFNCLDKDGAIYDETKYGWLQGRQVWMYAKLYNDVERFHTDEIRNAISRGADFLHHLKDPGTSRCYFSVTRKGLPIKLQRTIFTECFYIMALSEASKALGRSALQDEAEEMFNKVTYWVREDDSALGLPKLSGRTKVNSLAPPMMMLCCVQQMTSVRKDLTEKYEDLVDWILEQILMHSKRDGRLILENVSPDGSELPGMLGRQMNPGHAIECGWFLLEVAQKREDRQLAQRAISEFILSPLEYGWDSEYGGLFYKLDADQKPMADTEWNMKLWWPHCEAMIATLMSYEYTRDTQLLETFDTVFGYVCKYFYTRSGEWFGYRDQRGELIQDLKGGPFKGCFHVPRCLMMCEQIITRILNQP